MTPRFLPVFLTAYKLVVLATVGFIGVAANAVVAQDGSSGTGFLVGSDLVLTNNHIVQHGEEVIFVTGKSERDRFEAEVVLSDKANDLFLIRIVDPDWTPRRFLIVSPSSAAKLGTDVYRVGYPLVDMLGYASPSVSTGVLASLTGPRASTSTGWRRGASWRRRGWWCCSSASNIKWNKPPSAMQAGAFSLVQNRLSLHPRQSDRVCAIV